MQLRLTSIPAPVIAELRTVDAELNSLFVKAVGVRLHWAQTHGAQVMATSLLKEHCSSIARLSHNAAAASAQSTFELCFSG